MTQQNLKISNKIILSFIILMMISIVILACFSSIAYIVLYLILPSVVVMFFDRSNDKCLFISIAFFNLSGILLAVAKPFIAQGEQVAFMLITTPGTITSI
jgi:hypothetical protein